MPGQNSIIPGDLVRWLHVDDVYLGVVVKDLGIKTITRKYLIYWLKPCTIIECYEADISKVS